MDSSELILSGTVSPPIPLEHIKKTDTFSEERKKEVSKDFESVLISTLLDQMKNTIGEWGFEKDGASKQIQGIFWLYLARDIADNGGFGMWKDIYKSLANSDQTNPITQSLDKKL